MNHNTIRIGLQGITQRAGHYPIKETPGAFYSEPLTTSLVALRLTILMEIAGEL